MSFHDDDFKREACPINVFSLLPCALCECSCTLFCTTIEMYGVLLCRRKVTYNAKYNTIVVVGDKGITLHPTPHTSILTAA